VGCSEDSRGTVCGATQRKIGTEGKEPEEIQSRTFEEDLVSAESMS